ncbi:MAG: hypothetical protein M3Z19_03060, partial [Chloroflexota bacterium]|nr:hypothetical protein [Chloroflexota bacterium]
MGGADRSAREHVAVILSALEDGDNEGAADRAGQGLAAFPDAAVFHRLRGVALFALGMNAEAQAHLAAALAVDPLDNDAILALARLADAEDDPYTAAEHLLTAWEHDPANPDLRAELTTRLASLYGPEGYLQFTRPALAALYVRNRYPERAAREYGAILAEHPNRTDLRVAAALAQWRLGNLAETAEECAALLAEQPTVVPARWALADALARLGNGDAAREQAKRAARYDPDGAIAHTLIAGNPDAAIVDPDEPLRVPDDWRERLLPVAPVAAADTMTTEPDTQAMAPASLLPAVTAKSDTMRLVETLSGLAAALAGVQVTESGADAPHEQLAPETAVVHVATPDAEREEMDEESHEPEFVLPGAAGLAEALAALDAPPELPAESLPHPLDVPYAEPNDRAALAETPVQFEDESEPVIAIVEEDGTIITTQSGGEPSLDATDVLPEPPSHLPRGYPAPDAGGGTVGAHSRAPSQEVAPSVLSPHAAQRAPAALANARTALVAAGTDHERLRALLPGLRALVDAIPERPDSHRLLGDAYARLGLYAQAEGQYRQALLVRIAG